VLYLAEVKKQTRGFISGYKTELKLLACQHNDQTWSAVPGEEVVVTEAVNQLGEGALLVVQLGNNRQIQQAPELAGPELVRQLQKLSRLSEKFKDQQAEIEQWKQSLTYQSQELSRREMEMEARLEQLQQLEGELGQLEQRRRQLEEAWDNLHKEQQRLSESSQEEINPFLGAIDSQQMSQIQGLIAHLGAGGGGTEQLGQQLAVVLKAVRNQQAQLDRCWEEFTGQKDLLEQQQRELDQRDSDLKNRQQDLHSARTSLEEAMTQLQVQKQVLANKQELSRQLDLELQMVEALQNTVTRIRIEAGDAHFDHKIDLDALETMPLAELQVTVNDLQSDLDKLVRFVNDQEEELSLVFQAVQSLSRKLETANDYDRFNIEQELAEEQERKAMLDQTLVGQRRNLRERQAILMQHLRILRRRQGIVEQDDSSPRINLDPLLTQLEEWQGNRHTERQQRDTEIEHLQQSLQQLQFTIEQQNSEQMRKEKEWQADRETWQNAKLSFHRLQSRLSLYEEILQPLQDSLTDISQHLEELEQWFNSLHELQRQIA
jgi:chromosome segregation ATPase